MVQIISNGGKEVSSYQAAFAGGVAGAVTRAVAQPLDVLKIRFQLQLEPIKHGSKYSSVLQATTAIIKQEGLTTLWSGHIPAQFLSISYGLIQFSVFEKLIVISQTYYPKLFEEHKHSVNFFSGAFAASVATIFSFPFDTIRTRLIAEEKTCKAYNGPINAFSTMVRTEGSRSLFKGIIPTLAQIAPHAGIQFAIYKLFTNNILPKLSYFQRQSYGINTVESTLLANFISGSIAGIISKSVIYPFDLIKKRLQIQGFQEHRKSFGRQIYCNGILNCIQLTIKEEGFLSLYKGYYPSMLKAALVSALHFTVYDEIKYLILAY